MQELDIKDTHYLGVKHEFILKIDGARPILYSLDYINTQIYYLTPIEGFVLSLLDGRTPFSELNRVYTILFPRADTTLASLLKAIDQMVRLSPSQTGIGTDGLIEVSDSPIADAQTFDSRQFIISPAAFHARKSNPKISFRLDTPVAVYTVFTHRCLTDCAYCYADRCKMTEMSLDRWREIIREMRSLGMWLGCPDNGDTFARRDGIDLLECLIENDMHFLLSTKAHVSKEHVKRLVDAGFSRKVRGVMQRHVQLSIDAVDNEVSRKILNVKHARVGKTLETFENFLAFGIMPKIKAVITGINYDQPEKIVDLFYPRGARVFHFIQYSRSFHRHRDELFVDARAVSSLRRQFDYIRSRYSDIELVENLTQEPQGERTPEAARAIWDARLGCGGGWSALGISPNGKAFLCEQMKMAEPFFVGDASYQSIEEIWQGEPMREFIYPERDRFAGTACHACPDFENCIWEKGRCYRNAYFSYGSIYHPPPLCPNNSRPGLRLS